MFVNGLHRRHLQDEIQALISSRFILSQSVLRLMPNNSAVRLTALAAMHPDVILPMCIIRRMDSVLESTKQAVLDTKRMLDDARITEQRAALCEAAGQAFYNTSRFTLRDLKSRGSHQQLLADFEDYLNGFSPNVLDILENFKFRNQLSTLVWL